MPPKTIELNNLSLITRNNFELGSIWRFDKGEYKAHKGLHQCNDFNLKFLKFRWVLRVTKLP